MNKKILILAICLPWTVFASPRTGDGRGGRLYQTSFDEKYERYGSPDAFFNQLDRIIPNYWTMYTVDVNCRELNPNSAAIWGHNEPRFGKPINTEPGSLFAVTFTKCIMAVLSAGLSPQYQAHSVMEANYVHVIGKEISGELKKVYQSADPSAALYPEQELMWKVGPDLLLKYPVELRKKIVRQLILRFAGPESVLRRHHLVGENNAFDAKIDSVEALVDFLYLTAGGDNPQTSVFTLIQATVVILRISPLLIN